MSDRSFYFTLHIKQPAYNHCHQINISGEETEELWHSGLWGPVDLKWHLALPFFLFDPSLLFPIVPIGLHLLDFPALLRFSSLVIVN